jgi:filamentous hemagglutinin family protein
MKIYKKLFLFVILSNSLLANPSNMNVVHGEVKANVDGNSLHVQASDRAIINWDSFSINRNEITTFALPDGQSTVLNRVVGSNKSVIDGALNSNGNVYLLNQNGILIGNGAIINVGGLIASTFDIFDEAFKGGDELHFMGDSNSSIENFGDIKALDSDIYIISKHIKNDNKITSDKGNCNLIAASDVLLKPKDKNNVFIKPSGFTGDVGIDNNGIIEAVKVQLLADGNAYSLAINHKGTVDALGFDNKDGEIFLVAENGKVEISGNLYAKNNDECGGFIDVIGGRIAVIEDANITAAASGDGGMILIGKNYDGYGAETTYIGSDVKISADSLINGNGGYVSLWGDKFCGFYGEVSCLGGEKLGNGGFVEISSYGRIENKGVVNTSAFNGEIGTLLLDPCDIIVGDFSGTSTPSFSTPYPDLPFSGEATLDVTDLVGASGLANNNVELRTSGGTGGNGDITIEYPVTWSAQTTLTLTAQRDVIFKDTGLLTSTWNSGTAGSFNAVVINADRDLLIGDGSQTSSVGIKTYQGSVEASCRNLVITGGSAASSQAYLLTEYGASISLISSGYFHFIAGSGDSSSAYIKTRRGGNISCIVEEDSIFQGGSGATDAEAGILGSYVSGTTDIGFTNTGGKLTFIGGSAGDSSAASIVAGDRDGIGSITINLADDLVMTGGSGGSSDATYARLLAEKGNITISTAGDMIMTGGSGAGGNCFVLNEQGNISLTADSLSLNPSSASGIESDCYISAVGAVTANITDDIYIQGEDGNVSKSYIESYSNDITLLCGGFSMLGGSGSDSIAYLASYSDGNITLNSTGDVSLAGGSGDSSSSYLLVNGSGNITLNSTGDISLVGGSGGSSSSYLLTEGGGNIAINTSTAEDFTYKTLSLTGGAGDTSYAILNTGNGGNITANFNGDSSVVGGTGSVLSHAGFYAAEDSGSGNVTLNVQDGSLYFTSGLGTGLENSFIIAKEGNITVNVDEDLIFSAGINSSLSTSGMEIKPGAGNLTLDVGRNLTMTDNASYTFLLSNAGNCDLTIGGNLQMTAGSGADNSEIKSEIGNLTIDVLGYVSLVGGSNSYPYMYSAQNLNLTSGNYVSLSGSNSSIDQGKIITETGELNITATGALTCDTNCDIYTGSGAVTLISNADIILNNQSSIYSTSGDITLVTDNAFPRGSKEIGFGNFEIDNTSTITTTGDVRIFTSLRHFNVVNNTINSTVFSPSSVEGKNTNQERWYVYYPDSFYGGEGFTFFYKSAMQQVLYIGTLASSELFYYIDLFAINNFIISPYEKFIDQKRKHSIRYDDLNYRGTPMYHEQEEYVSKITRS